MACVRLFLPLKMQLCLSVCECSTLPVLESSSAPQNKCLLAFVSVYVCVFGVHTAIKVCVPIPILYIYVHRSVHVSPVLFMLDWLTYRVPQS